VARSSTGLGYGPIERYLHDPTVSEDGQRLDKVTSARKIRRPTVSSSPRQHVLR
jgi:hypothetical protein